MIECCGVAFGGRWGQGKLMMMIIMYSTMVGVGVGLLQVDPGYEVVVEWEGGQMSRAEGWKVDKYASVAIIFF